MASELSCRKGWDSHCPSHSKGIREIYAQLDAEWKKAVEEYENQTGEEFPCGPGCDDCCKSGGYLPFVFFPMSQAEAEVLWEALAALSPEARELVANRALCGHVGSCILLSNEGLCLVYESRPLWCRIFGLTGVPTCGKIEPGSAGGERWAEAVQDAYGKLRENEGRFVPLRELIDRLIYRR